MEKELYDIESLWHVPFWQTDQFFWIVIATSVTLTVLICAFIFKKRFYKKRVLYPWERALVDLAQLKKNNQICAARGKEFYNALTSILKEYMHNCYQINVISATDEELLALVENSSDLPPFLSEQVREVLAGMAFIKFANAQAAQKKIDQDFERVELIIKNTILDRKE